MIYAEIMGKISSDFLSHSFASSWTHFFEEGAWSHILMMGSYTWQSSVCRAGKTKLSRKAGVWQMMSATKHLTRHMIRVPWLCASDSWKRPAVSHEKENGSWNGVWELKTVAVLEDAGLGALYLLKHLQSIIKGKWKKWGKGKEKKYYTRLLGYAWSMGSMKYLPEWITLIMKL